MKNGHHAHNIDKEESNKIDILRGIAIIAVFLFHATPFAMHAAEASYNRYGVLNTQSGKDILLAFLPSNFGGSGVILFLLISGFLIHFGFLKGQQRFSFSIFYSKRFWRIFPPYLLVLFFLCFATNTAYHYVNSREGLLDFLSHAFMVHNFWERTFFSVNASFWSLALEVQLYVVYPLFLFLRRRLGIVNTCKIILSLSVLFTIIGFVMNRISYPSYYTSVPVYWIVWCAGALLAEKQFTGSRLFLKPGYWSLAGFILLLLSKYFLVFYHLRIYISILAWLAFFEWFIVAAQISLRKPLWRFVSLVGVCSYSIYLVHQPMLSGLFSYFNVISNKYLVILRLIPMFLIVFLFSYGLYLFVEKPSIHVGALLRSKRNQKSLKSYNG